MTIKEFAEKKASELKNKPFDQTIEKIANEILSLKVDGKPITETQIQMILQTMGEEIGDLPLIKESFDNTAALSLMARVHQVINSKKANGGK